jgi:type II secretory pathway pseudopilin PulG
MNKFNQGFTLLGSIFILVVLALAGTYLVRLAGMQYQSNNYDILTMRAKHAAQSAIALSKMQWQTDPQHCPEKTLQFDANMGALAGFKVVISCQQVIHYPQLNATFHAVHLQAVATKGSFGEKDYVAKSLDEWVLLRS